MHAQNLNFTIDHQSKFTPVTAAPSPIPVACPTALFYVDVVSSIRLLFTSITLDKIAKSRCHISLEIQ